MKVGDVALTPQITFLDTKAKIEAYPDPQEGMQAQQTDSPYQKAHYANGAWVWESGGGGTPGGADTEIQFNDGGAFGGYSGLSYNKINQTVIIGNGTQPSSINFNASFGEAFINNLSGGGIQMAGGVEGEGQLTFYGTPIFFGGQLMFDSALLGNRLFIDTSLLIGGDHTAQFPNKDGIVAMLDDIVVPTSPFLLMGG